MFNLYFRLAHLYKFYLWLKWYLCFFRCDKGWTGKTGKKSSLSWRLSSLFHNYFLLGAVMQTVFWSKSRGLIVLNSKLISSLDFTLLSYYGICYSKTEQSLWKWMIHWHKGRLQECACTYLLNQERDVTWLLLIYLANNGAPTIFVRWG